MQKIWNWFMKSSVNSGEMALTVKGSLVGAVTILTLVAGFANVQVGDLTPLVDSLVMVMQALFGFISALAVAWGLIRKLYLTFSGQHASI